MRRILIFSALAVSAFAIGNPEAFAQDKHQCAALSVIDPDNDGTLDLNEAKNAASKLFDKLDRDKDGTLSVKELHGHLTKKELAAGDPDKDKTLDKNEYLAIVEKRFAAANPDKDSTIDCKEISRKAGKSLLRLLK